MIKAARFCGPLCLFLATANFAFAANTTMRLGVVDPVADGDFVRLLVDPRLVDVRTREIADPIAADLRGVRRTFTNPLRAVTHTRGVSMGQLQPMSVAAGFAPVQVPLAALPAMTRSQFWLMLLVGVGLVAFHLRRKQKSLQYRSLGDMVYR